jgi:hypothetical protein
LIHRKGLGWPGLGLQPRAQQRLQHFQREQRDEACTERQNRSFFVDFTSQLRNGASAFDAMKTAGINALGKIADKLASMVADNLWAN